MTSTLSLVHSVRSATDGELVPSFMCPFTERFMGLGFGVSLWTSLLCSALVLWTPAEGQPRLISPPEPIIAAPGDDVILPCYLVPHFDVHRFTVEWSKPDLKPDPSDRLSRVEYVHLYRDRREVQDMKLRSYLSRTALFRDGLKHGNISLKILNVTSEDEGRYKCFIPKLESPEKERIVRLVVDPNLVKTWTTETPLYPRDVQTPEPEDETDEDVQTSRSRWIVPVASCAVLCLAAAAGVWGYVFKQQHKKTDGVKYDIAPKNPSPA